MVSYSKKFVMLILSIFLCFSSPFIFISSADNQLENNIDAVFNIEFISGTELIINVDADVKKITLEANGRSYDKNEILSIYGNESETMGAIKYVLKNSLTNQIKTIFNKANIHSFNELPFYNNGIFHDKYSINLTSNFFNFNNEVTISNFINGILNMGAIVNYTFNLIAESGWNNSFNFILSEHIGYHRTTGIVNEDIIEWYISNNSENIYSKLAEISIKSIDPNLYNNENITFNFEVDCNNKSQLYLSINANSINISKLILLPDFITNLYYLPSDGIRLFIENNLTTWDDFYNKVIKELIDEIKPKIESPPFNQTLNFSFKWDKNSTINCSNPFDIGNMDSHPPIKARFFDNDINILICGISSNAFFGLMNSGANSNLTSSDINFGNNFENINYPYTINLKLPNNISSGNKNIISWNNSNVVLGNISSNLSDKYTKEDIDTSFEIYVKTTDLNILSLFTGETKLSLGILVKEIQNRNVTILPYYFKLPDKINIDYYNSDLIRLCVKEEIFSNDSINSFLLSEKKSFESRLKNIFPDLEINGFLDKNLFNESLIWDEDITKMGNDYPIKISTFSNIIYPLFFKFSLLPPSLNINDQNLTFSGIENHNVKYKIIFPPGLEVKLYNESNKLYLNMTEDGKYYIEISFNENQSNINEFVAFKITPSILFIFSLFLPCIISLFITIILVIIIYILKRKRRINKQFIIGKKKDKQSIDNEDEYYIPPPPSK